MTKVNLKFLATLCLYCELATRLVITNQRAYLIEYNLRSHFFPRKGKKLQSKQFSYCKCYILAHTILDNFRLYSFVVILSLNAQCSRTDLIKRSLPRPKTTTAWKSIPHRAKVSKNWTTPQWVPLHKFFKNSGNSFTIITFKLILLSKKVSIVKDFNSC